jgi:hypothetical protein
MRYEEFLAKVGLPMLNSGVYCLQDGLSSVRKSRREK